LLKLQRATNNGSIKQGELEEEIQRRSSEQGGDDGASALPFQFDDDIPDFLPGFFLYFPTLPLSFLVMNCVEWIGLCVCKFD